MVTLARPDDDPIAIHTRVFKGDDGWYYELKIWRGNVDITSSSPTIVMPKKPLRSKKGASQALVYEFAATLKIRLPGI